VNGNFGLLPEHNGALDVLVRPPYGVRPAADMIARLRGLFLKLDR